MRGGDVGLSDDEDNGETSVDNEDGPREGGVFPDAESRCDPPF